MSKFQNNLHVSSTPGSRLVSMIKDSRAVPAFALCDVSSIKLLALLPSKSCINT